MKRNACSTEHGPSTSFLAVLEKCFYLIYERIIHFNVTGLFIFDVYTQVIQKPGELLKRRLHEPIKFPFLGPILGPYVVNRSVLALKTGLF